MEGFLINLIGTIGFSGIFLMVFFSIYYLYLKGAGEDVRGDKEGDMNKRLNKRILK